MLAIFITVISCLLAVANAGNYDQYIEELNKRNRALHDQFVQSQPELAKAYFDDYDNRVSNLQSQHYIKDSHAPKDFDLDSYWAQMNDWTQRPEHEQHHEVDEDDAWGNLLDQIEESERRREEEPYMNKIWGQQKVSGGSGESGQVTGPHNAPSKPQVKTDQLPSYCDPLNPCPIGVDPTKLLAPCDKKVRDTATFNYNHTLEQMANGECPCDDEHMMCPTGSTKVSQVRSGAASARNPFLSGSKRDDHEAKKYRRFQMQKRGVHANFVAKVSKKKNPWLDGVGALDSVQKKAGPAFESEEPIM